MGKVTKITPQRNKKRVNIFVDNEFKSGLDLETVMKYGLKVNEDIDDDYLDFLIEDSESISAFDTALNFISKTFKTQYEVKKKLYEKGYTSSVIEKTIKKLIDYNYIDDYAYAELYIKSSTKKSKREIENKLKAKGISSEILDSLLLEISDTFEEENATLYAAKYMKNKVWDDKNTRNLISNLIRRGYTYDISVKALNNLKENDYDRD